MSDVQRLLLEASVALEMANIQRDLLRDRVGEMQYHLQQTKQRADRMEQSLHAANAALARLSVSLTTPPTISSWAEVDQGGSKVLRLDNPVWQPTRTFIMRHEEQRGRLNSL